MMMQMQMHMMSQYMAQPEADPASGQYQGWVKSINTEKGFGFIMCHQTYAQHRRDVFVRGPDLAGLSVGSYVSFTCETNKQNMPQARDIRVMPYQYGVGMASGDDKGKGKGKGKEGKKGKDGKKGKGSEERRPTLSMPQTVI